MEELELIKLAQKGDENAFGILYKNYYKRAFALAYRLTNDSSDAEDVVQDAFIQIHHSLPQLRDPKYFYGWMKQIIHSKCIDLFYKNRNQKTVDPATIEGYKAYEEKRRYMLPESESEYVSEQSILLDMLSSMDDKYSESLYLAYFKQMKIQEIAQQLNLSEGTIKSRMRRGKQELKQKVQKFERVEERRLHFNVDVMFPSFSFFSFSYLIQKSQNYLQQFFQGSAVNVVCVASMATLGVSGTVMAVQDYQAAKNQDTREIQPVEVKSPLAEPPTVLPQKAFGSYPYETKKITTSKEAYFNCIHWADSKEAMALKTEESIQGVLPIYNALKSRKDRYWEMLEKRGWVASFQALLEEKTIQ